MHRLCAPPPKGQGRDPRDVAQWTWDQLACITLDAKELQQVGSKIVRMSASEAYHKGHIKRDPRGSLNTLIRKGLIEVPEKMRGTRFAFGPLPGDPDYEMFQKRLKAKGRR